MAVTTPYNDTSKSLSIQRPPWFRKVTVPQNDEVTIPFNNVTTYIHLRSDGLYPVRVAVVSSSSKGAQGDEHDELEPGGRLPLIVQTKQLILRQHSNEGDVDVFIHAALSPIKASDWPDLTEANGFDGVESHSDD